LKRGESSFMTDHYEDARGAPASLTKQNDTLVARPDSGQTIDPLPQPWLSQ
jgi:hypothetical protein